jgi:Flp pilus assembly pilin Flp
MEEPMNEQQLAAATAQESGQTMAEYGVILGVITLAIVTALGVFSTAISSAISTVAGRL